MLYAWIIYCNTLPPKSILIKYLLLIFFFFLLFLHIKKYLNRPKSANKWKRCLFLRGLNALTTNIYLSSYHGNNFAKIVNELSGLKLFQLSAGDLFFVAWLKKGVFVSSFFLRIKQFLENKNHIFRRKSTKFRETQIL